MKKTLEEQLQNVKVGDTLCYTIGSLTINNYNKVAKETKCYFILENGIRIKKVNGQGRLHGSTIYFNGINCQEENWEEDELDMWYY